MGRGPSEHLSECIGKPLLTERCLIHLFSQKEASFMMLLAGRALDPFYICCMRVDLGTIGYPLELLARGCPKNLARDCSMCHTSTLLYFNRASKKQVHKPTANL
jgi:hypothetical protein